MRISDWSSDVCSSDLAAGIAAGGTGFRTEAWRQRGHPPRQLGLVDDQVARQVGQRHFRRRDQPKTIAAFFLNLLDKCNAVPASIFRRRQRIIFEVVVAIVSLNPIHRSEEHTSELQSLMRISYAVFCLKKKKHQAHMQANYK